VIPDHAQAEIFVRLIDDGDSTREALRKVVAGKAEMQEVLSVPAVRLGSMPGFETAVVSFTTDIPAFGGNWGIPFLFGPGSIHVAHTDREHVSKKELVDAVQTYKYLVKELQNYESD
jgi:acetylornithine deacetylase